MWTDWILKLGTFYFCWRYSLDNCLCDNKAAANGCDCGLLYKFTSRWIYTTVGNWGWNMSLYINLWHVAKLSGKRQPLQTGIIIFGSRNFKMWSLRCLTRFISHLLKHREAFVGLVDGLLQPLLPLLLLQLLLGLLRLLRGQGGLLFFLLPQQLVASCVGVSLEKSDKSSSSINWAAVEAHQ